MKRIALAVLATGMVLTACGQEAPPPAPVPGPAPAPPAAAVPAPPAGAVGSPEGARVYFVEPKDGAEVTSPVRVVFGLSGMGVAPAGMHKDGTGHHHLLVDDPAYDPSLPLPATEQILHFGAGQTETTLTLAPGTHTLQLVLGDWKHQPHGPAVMSGKITITVK